MSPSTTKQTTTIAIASALAMSFSIEAVADDAVDISGEVQLRFSNSDAGGGGFTRARTKLIFKDLLDPTGIQSIQRHGFS